MDAVSKRNSARPNRSFSSATSRGGAGRSSPNCHGRALPVTFPPELDLNLSQDCNKLLEAWSAEHSSVDVGTVQTLWKQSCMLCDSFLVTLCLCVWGMYARSAAVTGLQSTYRLQQGSSSIERKSATVSEQPPIVVCDPFHKHYLSSGF